MPACTSCLATACCLQGRHSKQLALLSRVQLCSRCSARTGVLHQAAAAECLNSAKHAEQLCRGWARLQWA